MPSIRADYIGKDCFYFTVNFNYFFKLQFRNHLSKFNVNIERDIVSCSGDGAAVMVSFGRNLGIPFKICDNHTAHLAVIDVLYSKFEDKNKKNLDLPFTIADSDEECSDDEIDDDEETSDELEDVQFSNTLGPTIMNMRRIIKMFRASPLKTHLLKSIMQNRMGKSLKILLDCKTRWSSLFHCGKRFLEVIESIEEALAHREINKTYLWCEDDTLILRVHKFNAFYIHISIILIYIFIYF